MLSAVGILMLSQAAQGDDNPEMCEMLAGANDNEAEAAVNAHGAKVTE